MALAAGAPGRTIAATSAVWAGHQIEIKDFDVLLHRQGVSSRGHRRYCFQPAADIQEMRFAAFRCADYR